MPDPIVELLQTSPGIPYYMIPLLTMPLLALYYSETSLSLIYWTNQVDVEVYAIISYPKLVKMKMSLSNMTMSYFIDASMIFMMNTW